VEIVEGLPHITEARGFSQAHRSAFPKADSRLQCDNLLKTSRPKSSMLDSIDCAQMKFSNTWVLILAALRRTSASKRKARDNELELLPSQPWSPPKTAGQRFASTYALKVVIEESIIQSCRHVLARQSGYSSLL